MVKFYYGCVTIAAAISRHAKWRLRDSRALSRATNVNIFADFPAGSERPYIIDLFGLRDLRKRVFFERTFRLRTCWRRDMQIGEIEIRRLAAGVCAALEPETIAY